MLSLRKSTSALSLIPEESCKMLPSSTKSCESLYSNTSSCKPSSSGMLSRRKTPPGPSAMGGAGFRQGTLIPATTEVRQRVLSARLLRMKTYQNQLADAQQTIAELSHENRILRTLHKRQDSALSKYESTNAELPQLLHSHAEELRIWQAKHRNLQTYNKELQQKLKQKEAIILSLSDQNKYYSQLNKDKNLEERQRLTEKMHGLETRLQEKDQDMKLLARKMQLETKIYKQQVAAEQKKARDVLMKLEKVRLELSGYHKLDELQLSEKLTNIGTRCRANIGEDTVASTLPKLEKTLKSELRSLSITEEEQMDSNSRARALRKTHVLTPLQRHDRGDGDAACLSLGANEGSCTMSPTTTINSSSTNSKLDKQHSNLNYGDGYEHGEKSDVVEPPTYHEEDDTELEEEEQEYDEDAMADDAETEHEDDASIVMNPLKTTPVESSRMKAEISNIRKQINEDYKEREAFLDTFCRQASNNALREASSERRHGVTATISVVNSKNHSIPSSSKNKLLAALKAIDDNKCLD